MLLLLVLLLTNRMLGVRAFLYNAPSLLPRRPTFCIRMTASAALEVEQKFSWKQSDDLEDRLRQMGFQNKASKTIVDWYYDTPNYVLVRQDCWLRCRTVGSQAMWELKVGNRDHEGSNTTVYMEVEGMEAVFDAVSRRVDNDCDESVDETVGEVDGFPSPDVPNQAGTSNLRPFARIAASRSSWSVTTGPYERLSVDLDTTDSGYAVGEVEALVQNPDDIAEVKGLIRSFLDELHLQTENPPMGKLETYIFERRPELYALCRDLGHM